MTHSAINGQSLLQSGSDALPGQQGMWSIASAVTESPGAAASIAVGVSIAIAGRAIGANNRPATATHAKNRPMVARILTPSSYHIRRFVHSGRLPRWAIPVLALRAISGQALLGEVCRCAQRSACAGRTLAFLEGDARSQSNLGVRRLRHALHVFTNWLTPQDGPPPAVYRNRLVGGLGPSCKFLQKSSQALCAITD